MEYEVFYTIEGEQDSIVLQGDTVEEIQEKIRVELGGRNAVYQYSNWLNE